MLNTNRMVVALILCGLASYPLSSQQLRKSENSRSNGTVEDNTRRSRASVGSRTLTPDDGLAVIAAALDSRIQSGPTRDCSHLVHAIYGRAGFPYKYAPSSDLYAGIVVNP